ncbi:hypothetical protein Pfo_020286 [Paulownia fortunei]|nr:hypothetical protein Pfo_020286 [Paulownia fortunei]
MDKSWMMLEDRTLPQYENGVQQFLDFAYSSTEPWKKIRCPCKKCNNVYYQNRDDVEADLFEYGIVKHYVTWVLHGMKCCELRRKDRPDLDSVILPELERLRDLGSPIKPEGRFYHTHSQSRSSKESSSQVNQNRFDYMNSQGQIFQVSSSSSQETRDSNSETQIENQSKNESGSGRSTITTLEIMDYFFKGQKHSN